MTNEEYKQELEFIYEVARGAMKRAAHEMKLRIEAESKLTNLRLQHRRLKVLYKRITKQRE